MMNSTSSTRNDRYMDSTNNISSGYASTEIHSYSTSYSDYYYEDEYVSLLQKSDTVMWGWDKPVRTKIPNNYVRRKVNNRIRNTLPRKIRQIDL